MKRPPLVIVKKCPKPPIPYKLPVEPIVALPKEKVNPIITAHRCLGPRLQERGDAGYYLDGQPARLKDIMRATNQILRQHGQEPIGTHPEWLT